MLDSNGNEEKIAPDILKAFLCSFFNKMFYVEELHLFEIGVNKVFKLLKALYRLKYAPHMI